MLLRTLSIPGPFFRRRTYISKTLAAGLPPGSSFLKRFSFVHPTPFPCAPFRLANKKKRNQVLIYAAQRTSVDSRGSRWHQATPSANAIAEKIVNVITNTIGVSRTGHRRNHPRLCSFVIVVSFSYPLRNLTRRDGGGRLCRSSSCAWPQR